MPTPGRQVHPSCRKLPFALIFNVVIPFIAFCVLGLEEEVIASRLEADELCCRLNDLENRHEDLELAALDAVRAVRLEGHLLPDRLQSLPLQVRGVVALGIRRGASNALASA
jgi:hypothetical protein